MGLPRREAGDRKDRSDVPLKLKGLGSIVGEYLHADNQLWRLEGAVASSIELPKESWPQDLRRLGTKIVARIGLKTAGDPRAAGYSLHELKDSKLKPLAATAKIKDAAGLQWHSFSRHDVLLTTKAAYLVTEDSLTEIALPKDLRGPTIAGAAAAGDSVVLYVHNAKGQAYLLFADQRGKSRGSIKLGEAKSDFGPRFFDDGRGVFGVVDALNGTPTVFYGKPGE